MKTFLVLPLLAASACAYYPQEDGARLSNEVYGLSTQVQAIQKTLAAAEKQQRDQTKQLADLSATVSSLNTAARRNDADLGAQVDSVLQEVSRLRGAVETFRERMDNIDSQVNRVADEIDLRIKGLEEKNKLEKAKEEEKRHAEEDRQQREKLLADPKRLIEEVVSLVNGGKPGDARIYLREFLKRTQSDKSLEKYADSAQFLLAETYFIEQNYQLAASEYNAVRKNYPKSPKVPDALLKMGMCFEKLNLPGDAKLFYSNVVEKYAKTEAAKRAKERLQELK